MNWIRLIEDMLHLASMIILILKIRKSEDCVGMSSKTQELYLLVFCMRYLDLFLYSVFLYNTLMEIAFIVATTYTIYLIRIKEPYCIIYQPSGVNFSHFLYLLLLAASLALAIHTEFSIFEMICSYSIWLHALGTIPQLYLVERLVRARDITLNYMVTLGLYRFFYILHWY